MALTFSKKATPKKPSPLRFELLATELAAQSHNSNRGKVNPWAGRLVLAAFQAHLVAAQSRQHKLEPSLLRKVLDPKRVKARQRARARANVAEATGVDQATGPVPLNAEGPSLQQAGTQGNRKRKAPEVERGSLDLQSRKKTKASYVLRMVPIEPIPPPFTPTPAAASPGSAGALPNDVQDAVPIGGIIAGDLPGVPAHEHEAATMAGTSRGAPGDMNEDGWQTISVRPSPSSSPSPPPDSSAGPSMPSQPVPGLTPGWGFASRANSSANQQNVVPRVPSVPLPLSRPSSPIIDIDIAPFEPKTRWLDMATDFKHGRLVAVGPIGLSDISAATVSNDAPLPDNRGAVLDPMAIEDAFDACMIPPASPFSVGFSESASETASSLSYRTFGSLGTPSDADQWTTSTRDFTTYAAMPTYSTC